MTELIEATPALGEYALHFKYLLLNESVYTQERLLTIRNIVSTLFLAEGHYNIQLLEEELLALYDREEDKQAVSLFLNWFRQLALYGKVSTADYEQLDYVYRTKEEVRTMLIATLDQERKKIYQQGEAAGLVKGRAETQRQTIEQLLQFRFDLVESEQTQFVQQVAQIQALQQLDKLVNTLLNKSSKLADFIALLAEYLQIDRSV